MGDHGPTIDEALAFHAEGRPGKIAIAPSKPLTTARDLSLAYSPGVAQPCLKIAEDPATSYDYTARGNLVAVISNGTAVLGLGDLGALASKPVMEGKAVLFKRFADIDSIDLEVDTKDVDAFINAVRYLGPSWGGINLEDIKAPDCFVIEQRLREVMDIPIFHDDQHGTAIIAAAGLVNALHLTKRDIAKTRLVINGAGSAGIACAELVKAMGMRHDNVILCDTRGVIYQGRETGMNQWKSAHAANTDARTLAEALSGADVFFGLSVKGAVTGEMVRAMADQPIIFAMANPDPEITPEDAKAARPDVIMATGRSDYPNQVNNVLGFPYIFRGALDVRASTINDPMKVAAAEALAALAREDVPDEVARAYGSQRLQFGPDYLIPTPFDPRLIATISAAVAKAAMESGVAKKPIADLDGYRNQLAARLDPLSAIGQTVAAAVREKPKTIVFAEGEEQQVIRAAAEYRKRGFGQPILIGREDLVRQQIAEMGLTDCDGIEIHNARLSDRNPTYLEFLYGRLQRRGFLKRDCQRLVNQDRNVFGACMVANGDADGMVTGLTRTYTVTLDDVKKVIDPVPGHRLLGCAILRAQGRTVFISDVAMHELPSAAELADIAMQTAHFARALGHTPRVAFLSFSNFGNPPLAKAVRVQDAVAEMDRLNADFEYDGEMGVDVALDDELMRSAFPFCRLTGPANVLIMPALHSAVITYKMMRLIGGGSIMGPMLLGLSKPVQIVSMNASMGDIVSAARQAAYEAGAAQQPAKTV